MQVNRRAVLCDKKLNLMSQKFNEIGWVRILTIHRSKSKNLLFKIKIDTLN